VCAVVVLVLVLAGTRRLSQLASPGRSVEGLSTSSSTRSGTSWYVTSDQQRIPGEGSPSRPRHVLRQVPIDRHHAPPPKSASHHVLCCRNAVRNHCEQLRDLVTAKQNAMRARLFTQRVVAESKRGSHCRAQRAGAPMSGMVSRDSGGVVCTCR